MPSLYRDFVDVNGTEIVQDLKLRVLPITATVRFLPIGRGRAGSNHTSAAGIGFFNWRYTESGEFVDFSDGTIFRDRYTADGTAVGPVVLGGLRFPIGDAMTAGLEFRWQKAEGDTDPAESRLIAPKIDLGGGRPAGTCTSGSEHRSRRSPVEGYAASLGDPFEALQEAGELLRPLIDGVSAFSTLLDRHPPHVPGGPYCMADIHTSPLPSCRKSWMSNPSSDRSCM